MLKSTLIFFFYLFVFSGSPVVAQLMTPETEINFQIRDVQSAISKKEHQLMMLKEYLKGLDKNIVKATKDKNYNLVAQFQAKKEIAQSQVIKAQIELSELKMELMVLESEQRLLRR